MNPDFTSGIYFVTVKLTQSRMVAYNKRENYETKKTSKKTDTHKNCLQNNKSENFQKFHDCIYSPYPSQSMSEEII